VPLRHLFTKSVVARTDLLTGTVLQAEHLTGRKVGTTPLTPSLQGEHIYKELSYKTYAETV
jgi:hypothetical protein